MLNRTTLFALGAALAIALVPVAASAKGGSHGGGLHSGGHHGGHHGGKHAHHHHHKHHHHHHVRWHRWKYPVLIGSTGIAAYAATTGTCNCLTKSYLENGAVVFKDLCTQEMAMNPPADKQAQNAQ